MEFFRAQKVSLSLTPYNTLEIVFNFLNSKRIESLFCGLGIYRAGIVTKKHGRDVYASLSEGSQIVWGSWDADF